MHWSTCIFIISQPGYSFQRIHLGLAMWFYDWWNIYYSKWLLRSTLFSHKGFVQAAEIVICQITPDLCSDACSMRRIPGDLGEKKRSWKICFPFVCWLSERRNRGWEGKYSWEWRGESYPSASQRKERRPLKISCSHHAGSWQYGYNYSPSQ